jgi:hypothetical protein
MGVRLSPFDSALSPAIAWSASSPNTIGLRNTGMRGGEREVIEPRAEGDRQQTILALYIISPIPVLLLLDIPSKF